MQFAKVQNRQHHADFILESCSRRMGWFMGESARPWAFMVVQNCLLARLHDVSQYAF